MSKAAQTNGAGTTLGVLVQMVGNTLRRLDMMYPGYFEGAKHNHYKDFGYPEALTFDLLLSMYRRNGLAYAAVNKTIRKTWQDDPWLLEREDSDRESKLEQQIRQRFDYLRFWQRLQEADRRSMVGRYAGVILRFADNKRFQEPVDRVPGGLEGLVEIIPAWEGQLHVAEWDTDETSETYGQPLMFQFIEAQVSDSQAAQQKARSFMLHPDRVVVWSEDGTVHNRSALEPGYNDLLAIEKIIGAGGEGFWKNAKSSPVLQLDKDADIRRMAQAMGVAESEVRDTLDEHVDNWQKGFDALLMLQGIEAKSIQANLPSPEHFFSIAVQSFAASMGIPMKILVGMQTGERASTEDAREWAQTCMARRTGHVRPGIMEIVNRLERFGILPERDWYLDWTDLTEISMEEKIERAERMAKVNQQMQYTRELVFTPDEIRDAVGFEALSDAERLFDAIDDDDARAAAGMPEGDDE